MSRDIGNLAHDFWSVDIFFTYFTTAYLEPVVVVVALLFYVHGKHLRSCRDGQLT